MYEYLQSEKLSGFRVIGNAFLLVLKFRIDQIKPAALCSSVIIYCVHFFLLFHQPSLGFGESTAV